MQSHLQHSAPTWSLNYKASPTLADFHKSKEFVRGIKGPIGSGKSVACCIELFMKAKAQAKSTDGVRRTRHIVVRNTQPELETTTIKTWLDWFPESVFGKMNRKPPYRHLVKIADIEMEVIFLALDKPEDVKKLLSLECTYIWFNEARQLQKEVIDAGTGRVGRYPSKKEKPEAIHPDKWPTNFGIIMDTNPPDDSHWWYNAAEEKTPQNWNFFDQPSGISKEAENIENLPKGYYQNMQAGKTKEWIDVYVNGKYGFIQDGKPVYGSAYNDDVHTIIDIRPDQLSQAPVYIGVDFGLTPAAVFAQRSPLGQWLVFDEFLTAENSTIGLPQFAELLKAHINTYYPTKTIWLYGDPSGGFRDQQGKTAFDIFRQFNLIVRPAPTNKPQPRIEAVLQPLLRMVNGRPGFALSKRCKMIRRGFNGGYKYKRMSVSGEAKYALEPDKNKFSHPHDALQYALCGGGEYKELMAKRSHESKTVFSKDWKVF